MKPEIRVWAEEVRDHLRDLASGDVEPVSSATGVCAELVSFSKSCGDILSDVFAREFGEFSGSVSFPIRGRAGFSSASNAYFDIGDLWADDDYGDARRRYCDYLADCIDECLEAAA